MLRASIYNPALGSQDDIKDQMILHYGKEEASEQLKLIGIAQGLAELSNSIDGAPVSWVKTTCHLMVLIKVEGKENENWRDGYWIFATVDLEDFPYFVLYSIRDAYHRFCLLKGSFGYCIAKNVPIAEFWEDFFSSWSSQYFLGALAAPQYLRLVSGVLSPDIVVEIDNICQEYRFKDILIFSSLDYSFYWPGKNLELETRVNLQNLLLCTRVIPPCEPLKSSGADYSPSPDPQPSSPSDSSAIMPTPDPPIGNETQEGITPVAELHGESRQNSDPPLPQSSGFFSEMTSYLPNIAYMNAGNLPLSSNAASMFSWNLPQMPQFPTLETFKKPFESFGSYFNGHVVENTSSPVSRIIHSMQVMIKDVQHHLISYQKGDFVFTFISKGKSPWNTYLERSCALLSRDIEGMSFAADPPNPFNYLVLDSQAKTLTSTIPFPTEKEEHQAHELIVRALLSTTKEKSEVMRAISNWWVQHSVIDESMEIILCSKCSDSDISQFIGVHKATDDWVHSYRRRRGL